MNIEKPDTDISYIRKVNLRNIRDSDYQGSTKLLSSEVGFEVSKYVSASQTARKISGKIARRIEHHLSLEDGLLDASTCEIQSIYYLMLKAVGHYVTDIVRRLKDFPEVQECSAILGDFDVFVKIEVRQVKFLDIVVDRMTKLPGVLRTRTFTSIDSIHWQRCQPESYRIDELASSAGNFAQEFINKRINQRLNEVKQVEKTGEIHIEDKDGSFNRIKMLSSVKKELLAVRFTNDPIQYKESYFAAEKELLNSGKVTLWRLFVRDRKTLLKQHSELVKQAKNLEKIGCQVRFLIDSEWQKTDCTAVPEDFGVFDSEFVYVRHISGCKATIKTNEESVNAYKLAFRANWRNAMNFREFESFLYDS